MPAELVCPLCGARRAKRLCPALNQTICAVCCATKRMTEIRCPESCVYLAVAREHPSSADLRQQRGDWARMSRALSDLNEKQSRLFKALCVEVNRYQPPELQRLNDQDLAQAAAAMASTLETAVRGVIYQHQAESAAAARLSHALKPAVDHATRGGGTSAERDAAVVLRRIAELAGDGGTGRQVLDLLQKAFPPQGEPDAGAEAPPASRLIVP